jgi:hypothetical protein
LLFAIGDQRLVLDHDALERQKSVDARRRQAGLGRDFFGDLHRRRQRRRVDAQAPEPGTEIVRERRLDVAALEAAGGQRAGSGFDRLEARRQTQAQFEPAAIDAARFPAPARAIAPATAFGKTSHADERHRSAFQNRADLTAEPK